MPQRLVCALPALWKGLFYDPEALAAASERLAAWSFKEVDSLHAAVAREGLRAQAPDAPVSDVARELVELSAQGLARIDARNRAGETEALFLEPLFEILDLGGSPAEAILERWEGTFAGRVDRLVEYARY